jgi:hypothetical protein
MIPPNFESTMRTTAPGLIPDYLRIGFGRFSAVKSGINEAIYVIGAVSVIC